MPSQNKYELELAPLAVSDIKSTLQYTHEAYGAEQRQSYSDDIRKALKSIKINPKLGHSHQYLAPDYKVVECKPAYNCLRHQGTFDFGLPSLT